MSIVHVTKKPVEIQAIQWTGYNFEELLNFVGESLTFDEVGTPTISTVEGVSCCLEGDVLVKDTEGKVAVCSPSGFTATYAIEGIDNAFEASLEKHWNKEAHDNAPDSDWAVPSKKKLRIDDAKHVRLAWSMVARTGGLTDEERAQARKRILAKAKKLGMDTSHWTKENISKEAIDAEAAAMEAETTESSVVKLPDGSGFCVGTVKTPSKEDIVVSLDIPAPVDVFSYLLTHVAEESSELVWAAMKVQRYGFNSTCPTSGQSNRDKMRQELSELLACLEILNEELVVAGFEPVIADEALIQESKQTRLATLQMEHGLGRFYTGSEG